MGPVGGHKKNVYSANMREVITVFSSCVQYTVIQYVCPKRFLTEFSSVWLVVHAAAATGHAAVLHDVILRLVLEFLFDRLGFSEIGLLWHIARLCLPCMVLSDTGEDS